MRLIAKLFDLNTTSLIQTKRRCFSCYYILNIICHNHPLVCPLRVHVLLDVSRFSRRALSSSSNDLSNFHFKPNLNYLIKLIRTLFTHCETVAHNAFKTLINWSETVYLRCRIDLVFIVIKLYYQFELVISPFQIVKSFIRIRVIIYSSLIWCTHLFE